MLAPLYRRILVMSLLLLFSLSNVSAGNGAGFVNFHKLAGHMGSGNTYYLALYSGTAETSWKTFDTTNVHVLLETTSGQRIEIANEDLIINSLGRFTSQAMKKHTLFRFNLLIDTSGSVDDRELSYVVKALSSFFKHLPVVYEAQIIRFSSTIDVSSFTKNENQLVSSLQPLERKNTALFDAIHQGIQELKKRDNVQEVPFRFSVVLTDGKDTASRKFNSSQAFIQTVAPEAQHNDIPLIIVGVTDEVDEATLRTISKASGGIYVPILHFTNLDEAFHKITTMLMDTYIFRIPMRMSLNEVQRVLLVKKTITGKYETIQDINLR